MPADRTREHCSVSGRMISGLRPESKTLANKFAPTGPVSLSRSASVNARELSGSRFCRRRRSLACRRSGAKRQHMIRFRLTLLGRMISGPLRAPSRTSRAPTACGQNQKRSRTSSLLQALCRSRDPLLSARGNCPGVASAVSVGALLAGDLAHRVRRFHDGCGRTRPRSNRRQAITAIGLQPALDGCADLLLPEGSPAGRRSAADDSARSGHGS